MNQTKILTNNNLPLIKEELKKDLKPDYNVKKGSVDTAVQVAHNSQGGAKGEYSLASGSFTKSFAENATAIGYDTTAGARGAYLAAYNSEFALGFLGLNPPTEISTCVNLEQAGDANTAFKLNTDFYTDNYIADGTDGRTEITILRSGELTVTPRGYVSSYEENDFYIICSIFRNGSLYNRLDSIGSSVLTFNVEAEDVLFITGDYGWDGGYEMYVLQEDVSLTYPKTPGSFNVQYIYSDDYDITSDYSATAYVTDITKETTDDGAIISLTASPDGGSISFYNDCIFGYWGDYSPSSGIELTHSTDGLHLYRMSANTQVSLRSYYYWEDQSDDYWEIHNPFTMPINDFEEYYNDTEILDLQYWESGDQIMVDQALTSLVTAGKNMFLLSSNVTFAPNKPIIVLNYEYPGIGTIEYGKNSFAEGENTFATGNASYAGGYYSEAHGDYAMARGYRAEANGPIAIALGNRVKANKENSFAAGFKTVADGIGAVAFGQNNEAAGITSFATGDHTKATAPLAMTAGGNTEASGQAAIATGYMSKAEGIVSTASGWQNHALSKATHAEGSNNLAGSKAYYWDAIDFENKKIYLSESQSQNITTISSVLFDTIKSSDTTMTSNEVFEVTNLVKAEYSYSSDPDFDYNTSGNITLLVKQPIKIKATMDSIVYSEEEECFDPGTGEPMCSIVRNDQPAYCIIQIDDTRIYQQDVYADSYVFTCSANSSVQISGTALLTLEVYTMDNLINESFITPDWSVGDEVSLVNDNKYDKCAKIVAIQHNEVTLDTIPFDEILVPEQMAFDDYSILNLNKPTVGIFDLGRYSHAEGYNTKAINYETHAEGTYTIAFGRNAHAEGQETEAAYSAHSEGKYTKAYGFHSHTEGLSTQTTGNCAHAEGRETLASGYAAHAEGTKNIAEGSNSHAEGSGNHAYGPNSHAEGNGSYTSADASAAHAEGASSRAYANGAHAEGYNTEAHGKYSHAEGHLSHTEDVGSHAEGRSTRAISSAAHAEGNNTSAEGENSHAEGNLTQATATNAHAEGKSTKAISHSTHAEGVNTIAGHSNSTSRPAASTDTTKGYFAHSEGNGTWASGNSAHTEGHSTRATALAAHAEGYYTTASGEGAHAEGSYNSSIKDVNGNIIYNTASGKGSHVEGNSTIASAEAAHAEGNVTKATGNYSHAEGNQTEAANNGAHAEGYQTHATGKYSHAEGHTTYANSDFSHAGGQGTKTTVSHQTAIGKYNAESANALFIVGKGSSDTRRSNAFEAGYDSTNGSFVKVGETMLTEDDIISLKADICFQEGTQILMADGTQKAIEEVQYGDMIMTYDMDSNELVPCKSFGCLPTGYAHSYNHYCFDNGSILKIFGGHRVYDADKQELVYFSKMSIGDHVMTPDCAPATYCYSPTKVPAAVSTRKYTIFCETGLYFANNILCGHPLCQPLDLHVRTHGAVQLSDEDKATLQAYADARDNDYQVELSNLEYVKEAMPFWREQQAAKRKIQECKEKLAARDYKTIKAIQGKLTEEELVENINACEELRSMVNFEETVVADNQAQIKVLQNKYNIHPRKLQVIETINVKDAIAKAKAKYKN